METREISILIAVILVLAFQLIKKYRKKRLNGTANSTNKSSDTTPFSASKDDDYEPYSKSKG